MIRVNKIMNVIPKEKIYVIFSIMITLSLILGPTLTKSYAAEDSSWNGNYSISKKIFVVLKIAWTKFTLALHPNTLNVYKLENHNSQ